jgi:hypothetical protein
MRNNSIRHSGWCFPNEKPSTQEFDEKNFKKLNNTFGQIA